MGHLVFANPHLLYLLILLAPLIGWYIYKIQHAQPSIQISSVKGFEGTSLSYKYYLRHVPFALRCLAIALIIMALARPQSTNSWKNISTEGIDIVMTIDISDSMHAEDLKPNRLGAAIDVASKFIAGRPNDKMGLVVFAAESFTQCPLTTDHAVLLNLFKDITTIKLEPRTAIGMGLATAVSRLKDSDTKSKVVILLTDGENNAGEIDPRTAADLAKTFGIRVYTIGVGSFGQAPVPVQTVFGKKYQNVDVRIDEQLLQEISSATGGKYFRATDNSSLEGIYEEIDQMEKSKIDVKEYSKRTEEYLRFAIAAFIFLLLELIVRYVVLRGIPS